MGVWLGPMQGKFSERSFSYTNGNYLFDSNENGDWEIAILSSGVTSNFNLLKNISSADICIVAGGAKGLTGVAGGGPGGKGGEVITATDITLPVGIYTVTIGGSGANSVLSAPDGRVWTARSGYGKGQTWLNNIKVGVDGDWAWNDKNTLLLSGWRYGAGGGYGSYVNNTTYTDIGAAGAGGSVGNASDDQNNGRGGTLDHGEGYPGFPSTGQGGGGGRYYVEGSGYGVGFKGGNGGKGIILIRKHKNVITS